MFTGIVETIGEVVAIQEEGQNLHLTVQSAISEKLKIDQSVCHNGVCLTVVNLNKHKHTVTAVYETLLKTNLGKLQVGHKINLERAMAANAHFDGHFVQGHVDQTGVCTQVDEKEGSWYFTFQFQPGESSALVEKGSICVDGTSLTVVDVGESSFSVAIIPYTYQHTLFNSYKVGTEVNLEFDMIGKYILKHLKAYSKHIKMVSQS